MSGESEKNNKLSCYKYLSLNDDLRRETFAAGEVYCEAILLLLQCSSLFGQVPGTHSLHHSLSPAILFNFAYLFFFFLFPISFSSSSSPSFSFLFSCPLSSLFPPSSSSAPSFGSLFFSLIFGSLIASFRSLIIPSLGFPVRFFPTILPSNTSLNNPSPLNTCPIQFFFLFVIVSIRHLFSFTIVNTSSLLILSTQLIFSNPLHNHISSACNLLISSCSNVHVSHPYNTITIN